MTGRETYAVCSASQRCEVITNVGSTVAHNAKSQDRRTWQPLGDLGGPPISSRPVRVVIADDTEDMRVLLRIAMADHPELEVVGEAEHGRQAIELAAALRPDLLVLDLDMPVLDGIAALPHLRATAPETRVVVLSAHPASVHRSVAAEAGAAAYVEKRTPIAEVIEEVLRGADLLGAVLATLSASIRVQLPPDTTSPGHARRIVATTLGDWGQSDVLDTVQLLISELVTNVVVHTSSAPDVRISLLPGHVHVEVVDSGLSDPVARAATPEAVSGRGLQLVAALASAWGTTRAPGGKVVWFDVAR